MANEWMIGGMIALSLLSACGHASSNDESASPAQSNSARNPRTENEPRQDSSAAAAPTGASQPDGSPPSVTPTPGAHPQNDSGLAPQTPIDIPANVPADASHGSTSVDTGVASSVDAGEKPRSAACETSRAQLDEKLAAAQACNNSLGRAPCQGIVEGFCGCSVAVDHPDMPAAKAYQAAQSSLATECRPDCTVVRCARYTKATCQTDGSNPIGRCVGVQ